MKNKPRKAKYAPMLQTIELVEITDPAEQAALDKRCAEAEVAVAEAALAEAAANLKKAKSVVKRLRTRTAPPTR